MIFIGIFFFIIWLHFYCLIFLLSPHTFYHLIKPQFFLYLIFFLIYIYFFIFLSFNFVQYGIIFMNELHQNQDLKIFLWDWWRSRIYICDNTPLWMKKICKLKVLSVSGQLSYYRTCLILIVILQQYWSVSIKKLFISFKLWLNGVTLCFAKLFLGIHDILGY